MFIFPTGGVFGKGDRYNSVCTVLISAPPKEIAWHGVKFISPGPYNVIFPNSEKILQKANNTLKHSEKLEWKNPSILSSLNRPVYNGTICSTEKYFILIILFNICSSRYLLFLSKWVAALSLWHVKLSRP